MRHRLAAVSSVLLGVLWFGAAASASQWSVGTATAGELEDFHRDFSEAVYPYPEHGAKPLGVVGFEIYGDASYGRDFEVYEGRGHAIDGRLPQGVLSVARVGVRKGLPLGFDVEATYGRALGSDLDLLSGTLQWAMFDGGAVSPALAVRVTGSSTTGSPSYRLRQIGAEAVLSKGFPLLTPYVGAGMIRSESHFALAGRDLSTTRPMVFGGLTLNLLIPHINVEIQRGRNLQATVKIGFGL